MFLKCPKFADWGCGTSRFDPGHIFAVCRKKLDFGANMSYSFSAESAFYRALGFGHLHSSSTLQKDSFDESCCLPLGYKNHPKVRQYSKIKSRLF